MEIKSLSQKMHGFLKLYHAYFSVEILSGIFLLFLLSLLFSCFSPEQKEVSSPPRIEEKILGEVGISPGDIHQKTKETGENTQAQEPIRVQSTMTPVVDMSTRQEHTLPNTSEVPTSTQKPNTSGQEEEQVKEVLPKPEPNEEREAETVSPVDPLHKVKIGMNYEEVIKLIGEPDFLITKSADEKMKLYRWNREGKILYGRFEDGVLKRYSGKSLESENAPLPLTRELYDQLKEGMELDEVVALLQRAGTQVSSDNKGGILYLWTDKEGSSFSARFENNKLVRKSGFYVRPAPIEKNQITEEEKKNNDEEVGESSLEETTPDEMEEYPPDENKDVSNIDRGKEQLPVGEAPGYQESSRWPPQTNIRGTTPVKTENRRIIYAGNPKRSSDEDTKTDIIKQSSLRRKAKLPDYIYQLREGSYEIKIYNPLDTSVKVGLRSGKRGKNISIPAGSVKSIKVPRGDYQFVYIRDDEPTELQQGGSVTIDGLFVGDIEVMLLK